MKLIGLLICILSLDRTTQINLNGCLRIDGDGACQACDSMSAFILDTEKGECVHQANANCDNFSLEGTCLVCKENYYVDGNSQGKCIKVEDFNKVENCTIYDGNSTCEYCVSGYSMLDGKCE